MAEHANAALARRGYDAFGSGDLDTLAEIFSTDATWHEPGTSLISGDYVGRDRVFEFLGKLVELSGGTFRADPEDILADDDRAVVIQHTTARRNDATLDTRDVIEFEISDGRVRNVQLYASDPGQEEAFWA